MPRKECVLFRYTRKSGRIDKTLTGYNIPMLKLWALSNTTKSKDCLIIEMDSYKVVALVEGRPDFPKLTESKDDNLGMAYEYGIPDSVIDDLKDN